MKCPLTGSEEWENVDEFRFKPEGMMINKKSGFVSYPNNIKSEEDLKKYYRTDYRRPPTVQNLYTGQRKLHYHERFLRPLFDQWKEEGRESPVIGEIGSAYGLFLNWCRNFFPKADLVGTEWTLSMKRVAYWEFGLDLLDDLDPEKKYDMIASYKVLEHQAEPLEKLRVYRDFLKDDGYFYVSVPIWFNTLHNFGAGGSFDIEYYYHPDHINVWDQQYFESLLDQAGFFIEKFDNRMYDYTYLCTKKDPGDKMDYPGYEKVKDHLKKIHQAAVLMEDQDLEKAAELWPNFPYAYNWMYERNRQQWHQKGYEGIEKELLEPALEKTHNSFEILSLAADISQRYEKYEHCLSYLQRMDDTRPNQPGTLLALANVYRQMAERCSSTSERKHFYQKALDVDRHLKKVSLQSQGEAINWIYFNESRIPTPKEE